MTTDHIGDANDMDFAAKAAELLDNPPMYEDPIWRSPRYDWDAMERRIASALSIVHAQALAGQAEAGAVARVEGTNPATRTFINELGNRISIIAVAGQPDRAMMSRIEISGPKSRSTNNITRMEMEQLHAAIGEALASTLQTTEEPKS